MRNKYVWIAALLAVSLVAMVGPTQAQVPCFVGDDGFNVGCCKDPEPKLPDFPEVKEVGVYGCIAKCKLDNAFKVNVWLSKPQFFTCDMAIIEMNVSPLTPGGPTISGKIIAKYSRTWYSLTHGRQVWRFLLNGDWSFGPGISTFACPAPPHNNPSHVIGSLDYACDPTGTDPSAKFALNLSHLPGCISHGTLSARPLTGIGAHLDRSYHLVAPSNFSFVPGNDVTGVLKEEAVRSSSIGNCFPSTYKCFGEADMLDASWPACSRTVSV